MKTFSEVLFRAMAAVGLLAVVPASAGPTPGKVILYTSLLGGSKANHFICAAANVGDRQRNITVVLYDANDKVVALNIKPLNINPGSTTSAYSPGPNYLRCNIVVDTASGEKPQDVAASIRASLQLADANGNTIAVTEAR